MSTAAYLSIHTVAWMIDRFGTTLCRRVSAAIVQHGGAGQLLLDRAGSGSDGGAGDAAVTTAMAIMS